MVSLLASWIGRLEECAYPRIIEANTGDTEANNCLVDVAQLVEPRIVDPVVVGSIPIVHPILD